MSCYYKHVENFSGDFGITFFGFLGPSGSTRGRARTKIVEPRYYLSIASAATVWSLFWELSSKCNFISLSVPLL